VTILAASSTEKKKTNCGAGKKRKTGVRRDSKKYRGVLCTESEKRKSLLERGCHRKKEKRKKKRKGVGHVAGCQHPLLSRKTGVEGERGNNFLKKEASKEK